MIKTGWFSSLCWPNVNYWFVNTQKTTKNLQKRVDFLTEKAKTSLSNSMNHFICRSIKLHQKKKLPNSTSKNLPIFHYHSIKEIHRNSSLLSAERGDERTMKRRQIIVVEWREEGEIQQNLICKKNKHNSSLL